MVTLIVPPRIHAEFYVLVTWDVAILSLLDPNCEWKLEKELIITVVGTWRALLFTRPTN